MKRIFRNLMFGLALCAGAGVVSCSSDIDDPMDTIPYNRVLTPMNFEAEVVASKGTDITFKWSAVQNAESYVLEMFEAIERTETDENGVETTVLEAPDYETAVPALSVDVAADQVPYTVADLEVDKSFFARVRGVSTKVAASHWAYLIEAVSTSAVRSMLNPVVVERTTSTVKIAWDDAEDKTDLTSVRVLPVQPAEGEKPLLIALTAEQIEACALEITGLEACRNYKFTLLFGKSGSRGVVTAWTRPETGDATRIESAEALYNAINGATGDIKLLLAYNNGAAYDLTPYMTATADGQYDPMQLTCNLYLYGESAEDGKKPVVKAAFKTAAGESAIHCEDIMFDSENRCGATVAAGGKLSVAEFINCEYANYTKGIYSGSDGCDVESLLFDGVYAHDINALGTAGGDFIDIRGGSYGKIEIKNSTFYACARTFLRVSDKKLTVGSIDVANCTFNQVTATSGSSNNSGIFHVRHLSGDNEQATITGTFTMRKCLFMNILNDNETESKYWCKLTRLSAENYAPTCDGNMYYNVGHDYESVVSEDCSTTFFYNLKSLQTDGTVMTQKQALAGVGAAMLADDPCVNSLAGKMYLKNGVIAANQVGDPRWWDLAEPVVIRETELTTVTEPTVWDFTEKTKFQTETVETNQIIENILIYAPAEIVMKEGLTFPSAAAVDRNGRPTSSALQFRVQGVGAVEVTTADAGYNATVEVVAAGDRYTLLADGKTHKVVLGDLAGENDIYVLAGSAVTFKNVAWTSDLTPEATVKALDAPNVTIDNKSFDEGTSVAVTASWEAVENAATYEVTFKGKKTEISGTSFTIDAAEVAALPVGEYEISVVAKPVTTSSKYVASEAGTATFKVKKIILAGVTTVLWDFNAADFDAAAAVIGTTDNTEADAVYTMGGVDLHIQSLGSNIKVENRSEGRRLRTGGAGKVTQRAISFIVPKTTASASLKINGTNSSSKAADQTLVFTAQDKDATVLATAEQPGAGYQEITLMDGVELQEGTEIFICCSAGYRYSWIEFSYADDSPAAEPKEWIFSNPDFAPYGKIIIDAVGDGQDYTKPYEEEWDGLTISNGGGNSIRVKNFGKDDCCVQMGGAGGSGADQRHFSFEAPAAGKVTVVASNTGGSPATGRMVTVEYGSNVTSQHGGVASSERATCTFDIDITEATTVYVYPTGGGLRFFSISYTPNK